MDFSIKTVKKKISENWVFPPPLPSVPQIQNKGQKVDALD